MNRNKIISISILSAILCVVVGILAGCSTKPVYFTVTYIAGEGGTISGEPVQSVEKGGDATSVKAVSDEEYMFVGWSDGVLTEERTDINVIADITVSPIFSRTLWKATYYSSNPLACDLTTETRIVDILEESVITVNPNLGYKFVCWSDGITTPTRTDYFNGTNLEVEAIIEFEFHNFPVLNIITQNLVWPTCDYVSAPIGCVGGGITNNEYVNCDFNLYDKNSNLLFNTSSDAKIKIRGNTSAYSEKKPYKIKLSQKADLLEGLVSDRDNGINYKDKNWLLLASGESINQIVGSSVSEAIQMNWTPAFAYVVLYFNGDFRGLYILCEAVSQGSGTGENQSRCAVDDDGFIIEYDAYWWNEDLYFYSQIHQSMQYTFKYPDSDDITTESEEYVFIQNYISDLENSILNGDESYKDFIDEESFAKWLLAQDFFANSDPAGSNIFLTKKDSTASTKLVMGPLWDFDGIKGETESYSLIRNSVIFYFKYLLEKESFVNKYNELFNEVKDKIVPAIEQKINMLDADGFSELLNLEKIRWGSEINDLKSQLEESVTWFNAHIQWMEEQIS